ncbi:hypothetical protein [Catellatospora tritici]|uniref:hypothetical protein n=1 Tax=Catellatospora tritici TaxID=2851566 RepID=UPI001C2D09EB|nr:hypothetical protein [Catellatospora tritici]MBV1853953.1 hypothetical protein [Catellatospora tritici]
MKYVLAELSGLGDGRYAAVVERDGEVLHYTFTVTYHDPFYALNSDTNHYSDFVDGEEGFAALARLHSVVHAHHRGARADTPMLLE